MSVNQYSKKIKLNALLVVFLSISCLPSCTTAGQVTNAPVLVNSATITGREAVIKNYTDIVYASYQDSLAGVKNLQAEVNKFIAKPSKSGFDAVKTAWLKAMIPYGQTEGFRFYDGPVDNEAGERMNSWPVGELSVDYVEGNKMAGIINNPQLYPDINEELIMELNHKGGEKDNITGFHAIEFLIWGQDLTDGPGEGQRQYTDYLTDGKGTNTNQQRRAQYLSKITDLLVADMESVVEQWSPIKADNYRAEFLKMEPDLAITKIIKGIATLSENDLPVSKMAAPLDAGEREQELSGFSDSTLSDLKQNIVSLHNVLNGSYTRSNGTVIQGPGINGLIEKVSPELAAKLKNKIALSSYLMEQIKSPFDQEIKPGNKEGNKRVKAALDSIQSEATTIINAGYALGLTINTEE
jgi:putative iron-regulated protein